MITAETKPQRGLWHRLTRPRILAVFSYRYDAHLVPCLLQNIEPYVDGWVSFDDRHATDLFSNEPQRRKQLLQAARQHGAQWILAIDPDERIERVPPDRFRTLTSTRKKVAWNFHFREMFSLTTYRTDGIWGEKRQPRLFTLPDERLINQAELHGTWFKREHYVFKDSGINMYHLKMIVPERRIARRDLYKHLDADGHLQTVGYDYLADELGATFEEIPEGRGFHPPHQEDGGLWMGDLPSPPSQQRVEQPEQVLEEAAVSRTFVPKIGI